MCVGPIRLLADRGSLALFAAFDLIVINAKKPYHATPNDYDFYFMALEETPYPRLNFWFPFATQPMPMDWSANDQQRRDDYIDWQARFIESAIHTREPENPRSFGWDSAEIRRTLGFDEGQPIAQQLRPLVDALRYHPFSVASQQISIEVVPLIENHQYFVVEVDGVLKAGDLLHVHFHAERSLAAPMAEPCAGRAPLFYYNHQFDESDFAHIDHEFRGAPVIPAALMQVTMAFPTPATVKQRYAIPLSFSPELTNTPWGGHYPDWHWLVICNAHRDPGQDYYNAEWKLADCADAHRDETYRSRHEIMARLGITGAEARHIDYALDTVDSLEPQILRAAQLRASGMSTRDAAKALSIEKNSIQRYMSKAYKQLGFTGLNPSQKMALLANLFAVRALVGRNDLHGR